MTLSLGELCTMYCLFPSTLLSRDRSRSEEELDRAEPKLTRVKSMDGRLESTASDDGSPPPSLRKNVSFGDLSITRIPSSSDLTATEKKAAFFQRSDYRSFGVAESKLRRKLGISMQGIPSKAEEKRVTDHLCSEEQASCLVS